ncbi:hypothetical protein [Shimia aestuarii]|uniref:Uncharacterized protein n=1 Tax=Shimia aestuarii TaxID=254406 RepID=A0A1I4HT66_9RHOB|nr:hypothetical protein [Shimia aestuarii]SFL44791.1 hypothetical protein SAMN04488042_101235 [Shimia aestuarii]
MTTDEGLLKSGSTAQTPQTQSASENEQTQSKPHSENASSKLSKSEKLEQINKLLSPNEGTDATQNTGQHAADPASSGDGAAASGEASAPESGGTMSIKELATQLGTTPKKLYESLEIGLGDGETITLSEMKSQYKGQHEATRDIVERENQLSAQHAQTLENLQLLNSVYDDLKGKLSPETLQQLQERTNTAEAKERALMVQAMPELTDPAKLDTFRNDVAETMAQFGFKPHELVIRDHRIALAIKELISTKRQLKALMEFEPTKTPPRSQKPQGKRVKPSRTADLLNKARAGSNKDKAAAVDAILKGH